jgi:hypothetical protein
VASPVGSTETINQLAQVRERLFQTVKPSLGQLSAEEGKQLYQTLKPSASQLSAEAQAWITEHEANLEKGV